MQMAETRDFPIEVVMSLYTGILLCKFGDMHECAEFLLGHPVWTHEFADRALSEQMRAEIKQQLPRLHAHIAGELAKEDVPQFVEDLRTAYGPKATLKKGNFKRTESPIDTARRLVGDDKIIALEM